MKLFKKLHDRNIRRMEVWNMKKEKEKLAYLANKAELSEVNQQGSLFFLMGFCLLIFGMIMLPNLMAYVFMCIGAVLCGFGAVEMIAVAFQRQKLERGFFRE